MFTGVFEVLPIRKDEAILNGAPLEKETSLTESISCYIKPS